MLVKSNKKCYGVLWLLPPHTHCNHTRCSSGMADDNEIPTRTSYGPCMFSDAVISHVGGGQYQVANKIVNRSSRATFKRGMWIRVLSIRDEWRSWNWLCWNRTEYLQKHIAPGAFHNSAERFEPPKCYIPILRGKYAFVANRRFCLVKCRSFDILPLDSEASTSKPYTRWVFLNSKF